MKHWQLFNINDEVMSKVSYYTAEGLKKLRDELRQLKDVERVNASKAIAEAIDKGDLSENAEYDAAKEAQGMLEMRISKLEEVYTEIAEGKHSPSAIAKNMVDVFLKS